MNRKTKRNIAVVAGLTAVLALSPVAGALTTAHADETAPETVSAQSVEGVDPQSSDNTAEARSFLFWHCGNWDELHTYVDLHGGLFGLPDGLCDRCGAPYWDGCNPGGDEDPEYEEGYVSFQCTNPDTEEVTWGEDRGPIVDGKITIDSVPEPEQYEGYTFVGWSVCGADPVSSENLMGTSVNPYIVIEAKYAPVEPEPVYYTVTFDDMVEDTENQKVTVEEGKSVSDSGAEVSDPTREGYTFVSWYTSTEYTTEFDFDTPIKGDMTVYAKWVEDEESTDPTDPTDPGTDPEEPGTDPENPGDGSGDQGDTTNPGDGSGDQGGDNTDQGDNTDKGNDTTKPAGDATSTDDGSNDDAADEDAIPNTGDATVAVSGIAALGTAAAGLGIFLRRRS